MKYLFLLLCTFSLSFLKAQVNPPAGEETKINMNGQIYSAYITPDGDTLILADLDKLQITALRKFDDDEAYRKYMRFRNYAQVVFPYAKEAIRIFRELEYASTHLSKREKKKRIKELEEELSREFEEPLKNLTKLQGKIMIKMIEKETGKPMYDLIKDLKGGFSAFYWNAFSKIYTYELKEGYNKGQYPILDAVLQDFDVSYRIENGTSLKYVKLDRSKKEKK
ncbi:MAG: DUF4294 domain-containing protein [Saprospiraceae bacterium]|nr:DUF4294 domain-containing protein [Saprospiraceae bacterium]